MAVRHWFPKQLTSRRAKSYASLHLVRGDLAQVEACCKKLSDGDWFALDPSSRALLDSALIRYRRCFNKGGRTQLNNMAGSFSPLHRALHERVLHLANLHIAHSINGCEQGWPGIQIDIDEAGNLTRGGLCFGGYYTPGLSGLQIEQLAELAEMLGKHVDEWIASLSIGLTREVADMTDGDVLALANWNAPDEGDIGAERPWPPFSATPDQIIITKRRAK